MCHSRRQKEPYIAHIDFGRSTTDNSPWCKPLVDAISLPYPRSFRLVASPEDLRSMLAHPILPSAILCTPGEIAKKQHANLRGALKAYIEQGGRVVLGGPGIGWVPYCDIPKLLSSIGGVSWKTEGYHRTTHTLNAAHPLVAALPSPGSSPTRATLPDTYSCKAIVLKGVATGDMMYRSTEDSGVESLAMLLHGGKVGSDEVAVAATKVGEGWFAWCGDVNQEEGTTAAMKVLLGL